jgi:hypothetical protein
MIRVALATVGLAGGVYAAEQVTAPPGPDMAQTVKTQRANEGRKLTAEEIEHQRETLTPEQMLELSAKYEAEMGTAMAHAESVRIAAYQTRDIIRITCIDDKLGQMKEVVRIASPRYLNQEKMANDPLQIRQHFIIVQQAQVRVGELLAEVDSCIGDNIDSVAYSRIKDDRPRGENVFDPTRPAEPTHEVDRPPEASPFR